MSQFRTNCLLSALPCGEPVWNLRTGAGTGRQRRGFFSVDQDVEHIMKTFVITSAFLAAALAAQMPAFAQGGVKANERYCLEAMGGGQSGGPQPLLCRFATLEQCNASKTGQTDRCMLNPALGRRN